MYYSVYVGDERIDDRLTKKEAKDLVKKCIKEGQTEAEAVEMGYDPHITCRNYPCCDEAGCGAW